MWHDPYVRSILQSQTLGTCLYNVCTATMHYFDGLIVELVMLLLTFCALNAHEAMMPLSGFHSIMLGL